MRPTHVAGIAVTCHQGAGIVGQNGVGRRNRPGSGPVAAGVIRAIEGAVHVGIDRSAVRPADDAAGPAFRQYQGAGRCTQGQADIVHVRGALATRAIVIGAEL